MLQRRMALIRTASHVAFKNLQDAFELGSNRQGVEVCGVGLKPLDEESHPPVLGHEPARPRKALRFLTLLRQAAQDFDGRAEFDVVQVKATDTLEVEAGVLVRGTE